MVLVRSCYDLPLVYLKATKYQKKPLTWIESRKGLGTSGHTWAHLGTLGHTWAHLDTLGHARALKQPSQKCI